MGAWADRQTFDAVVVGSGFGGAINALRLAEAGRSVLVLERGRRYRPGDFPRDVRQVDRLFWRHPKRAAARGLYDMRFLSGIGVIAASGVGGGSLIYANIHIRPDPVVFEDPRWPRSINRATLDPYYDKVARMLGVAPLPDDLSVPKRDAFRAAAKRRGWPTFEPDQAVAWRGPMAEGQKACELRSECEFGCNLGAKNTLDFNYLAQAQKLGARVEPNIRVSHVAPEKGGYRVFFEELDSRAQGSFVASRVVLSAGTLGSNEILFRSRANGTLPKLSDRLGRGFSGNGDFLGNIQNSTTDLQPWRGPDVTTVARFFDAAPQFTLAAPGFNEAAMRVLASFGQPGVSWLRPFGRWIWPGLNWLLPFAFERGWMSQPSRIPMRLAGNPARMTNLFAIGRDNAGGVVRWRGDQVDVEWDFARENAELIARMTSTMQALGEEYGGRFAPLPTWELCRKTLTVHPLGGCRLSDSPEQGVVSPHGEVHGYPGLFVADGSVIPTAIGFHPAMTISAVAERIAEAVAASFIQNTTIT
jgi:cholesterol oxidase